MSLKTLRNLLMPGISPPITVDSKSQTTQVGGLDPMATEETRQRSLLPDCGHLNRQGPQTPTGPFISIAPGSTGAVCAALRNAAPFTTFVLHSGVYMVRQALALTSCKGWQFYCKACVCYADVSLILCPKNRNPTPCM